jgi:hypothetical protein
MDDFQEEPIVQRSTKVIAWIVTLLVLGGVWGMAAMSLPKRHLFTAAAEPGTVSASSTQGVRPSSSGNQAAPTDRPMNQAVPATQFSTPATQADSPRTASDPRPSAETPASFESQEPVPSAAQAPVAASATTGQDCRIEVERLCPNDLTPGARRRCVQTNAQQLPVTCRQEATQRFVRMRGSLEEAKLACDADARRFCANRVSGRGSMLQCLRAHARDLSEDCRRLLPGPGAEL